MTSISETLFDTYGDSLMQEYAPYDEAEILAALDRMSMPQDMQIQVCDLLSSCYLRWGTAAFAIGLGLGLSMIRQIVSLHGGSVSVESQPGQGSCFTVRLPLE